MAGLNSNYGFKTSDKNDFVLIQISNYSIVVFNHKLRITFVNTVVYIDDANRTKFFNCISVLFSSISNKSLLNAETITWTCLFSIGKNVGQ